MKIIQSAELDVQELEHLKAIAQINCDDIDCRNCQLEVQVYGGYRECIRDTVRMCLIRNKINFERSDTDEQNN